MSKRKGKVLSQFGNPARALVEDVDLFGRLVFHPAPREMETGLDNVFTPGTEKDVIPIEELMRGSRSAEKRDRWPASREGGAASDFDLMRGEIEEMLARAEERRSEVEALEKKAREDAERLLSEANARADELIEAARAEAAQSVEDARRQVDNIEARAYQAGFEQGEEAGRQLGEQKMDSVIRGMSAVIDEIVSQRDSLMRGAEEDLVKTAYDIALKLISRELRQDPSVVLDVVRAALLKARNATKITIQLAPHDFRFIQDRMDEVRKAAGSKAELEIVASPEVGRGGCRIVSDAGEVDARLEETLKGLRREIWGDSAESADELEALWPDEDNPV